MIYAPSDFIHEILTIIKNVFVESDSVFNKILKNDEPNQLEKMRYDIESAFLRDHYQSLEFAKTLAKNIISQGAQFNTALVPNAKTSQYNKLKKVQVSMKLVQLRYLPVDDE